MNFHKITYYVDYDRSFIVSNESSLTFGDLFSGAGLFSAGMMKAGLTPAFAIELSRDASASYRRNVGPLVINRSVEEDHIVPEVDVLVAGPPCQGFSTLGRRDPTDVRNDLCMAVLPWISRTRPKIVVIENVPPFLRSTQWRSLAAELKGMGFGIQTWELDAVDFGTPQLRRRAFTIASRVGNVAAPAALQDRTTTGDTILDEKSPLDAADPMHIWPEMKGVAARRITLVPPGGDKRDILVADPDLCPPSWKKIGCQATDVWGRMDPKKPANTLRCTFQNPSKGRYLHPYEDRVLSLREGARLQGVPDDWIFEGRPYPIARQIGNGVPVPLGRAVGNAVRLALS